MLLFYFVWFGLLSSWLLTAAAALLQSPCAPRGGPAEASTQTLYQTVAYIARTKTGGWKWAGWWEKTKYVTRYKTESFTRCSDGYDGEKCEAMCHGEVGLSVCNRNEGYVKYINGTVVTCSGGACVRPNTCINCNKGYYSSRDGYCRACKPIANCLQHKCMDDSSSTCDFCRGEIHSDKPGYNVFVGKPSNQLQCDRACSWEHGFRCYPGTCSDPMMVFTSCKCSEGFHGTDCANYSYKPNIYKMEAIFIHSNPNEEKLFLPEPGSLECNEIRWTKVMKWERVNVNVGASDNFTIGTLPAYINKSGVDVEIGITDVEVNLILERENQTNIWTIPTNCGIKNINLNNCVLNVTEQFLSDASWGRMMDFRHKDRLTFKVTAKNGGFVSYKDMESWNIGRYNIAGQTTVRSCGLHFDDLPPQHCYEYNDTCSEAPLITPDFTQEPSVKVSWSGWVDADAGIHEYDVEVIPLAKVGNRLDYFYGQNSLKATFPSEETSAQFLLPSSGPYAVQLTVRDKATNIKTSRRILIFDNESTINTTNNLTKIKNADNETGEWINVKTRVIELSWAGRFVNELVHNNGWLNEVAIDNTTSRDLDDNIKASERNTSSIYNINGIVRFEVGYDIFYDGTVDFIDFASVPYEYFTEEKMYVHETLEDGMRLQFHVRAFDVMDRYLDDLINVTVDFSPPVITDLWLTKGDRVNISVHNILELNNLTFEWIAYDPHSGLKEISWRLFDNYTNIEHGRAPLGHPEYSDSFENCTLSSATAPRAADCYCTPFSGCHHRHFQVKPKISITGEDGIHTNRSMAIHDSDYFIEVTSINKASLKTVKLFQITIDTSPPHQGRVSEGFPGEPEVDYQTSRTINAHWSGFFDKESGVLFYMYWFGNHCLNGDHFILDSTKNLQLTETFETAALFNADSDGTYYVTVAAYNRALDPSLPVCSDGVTIDTTTPFVSELVIEDAVSQEGLIKDTANNLWYLNRRRIIQRMENADSSCIDKATAITSEAFLCYPRKRNQHGKEISLLYAANLCNSFDGVHSAFISYITDTHKLKMSWNVTDGVSGIYDFEVGLASTTSPVPDLMSFKSTHKHQHLLISNPNIVDGAEFYVIIQTTGKSSKTNVQMFGPFVLFTSTPDFNGHIGVHYEENENSSYLVATWDINAFEDHGDPIGLYFTVAIGTTNVTRIQGSVGQGTTLVNTLPFTKLSTGGSCLSLDPPICTAIELSTLHWDLHSNHKYYISIKATNVVGLYTIATSSAYTHDISPPTGGVVYDIGTGTKKLFQDIIDIDFQTDTDTLAAEWSGFYHSNQDIHYRVCYTTDVDVLTECIDVQNETQHRFDGLSLQMFKTYYQVVIAKTSAGEYRVASDGVTIVKENISLSGIQVFDGLACNGTGIASSIYSSHHSEDKRIPCAEDIDYQASSDGLSAHWFVPEMHRKYTPDVSWAIEEKAPIVDYWTLLKEYEHIKTSDHIHARDMVLQPGKKYRVSVKFCAGNFCYKPVASNGVYIVPNTPLIGNITVQYSNDTKLMLVNFDRFHDADIEHKEDAYSVMDDYEWALTDNSIHEKTLTKWKRITKPEEDEDAKSYITFNETLFDEVEFSKCWRVAVRGFTKAGLSEVVAGDLQNCKDYSLVHPSTVIDAVGESASVDASSRDGKPVQLQQNADWPYGDADYTPFNNIISAVWPKLRYNHYTWAVIRYQEDDPVVFYRQTSQLQFTDPCSHPEAVACGKTDDEYMNAIFTNGKLSHGHRYIVCIHANATQIKYEEWSLDLEELSVCSDGVTVDLTPPRTGKVWIGHNPEISYQTSATDMAVNWDSFTDVEELGFAVHDTGIARYEVALGSAHGGVDISDFINVGVRNHYTFHNINLQNGHTYFACVRGYDFTNQRTTAVSAGVKVDTTPPLKTNMPVYLGKTHLTEVNYIKACWDGIFLDPESGISKYEWSVSSQPGYDDMMEYTQTLGTCAETAEDTPLQLEEGHSYFVSVKAYNPVGLSTLASSWAFTVDASPPVAGFVYDGKRTTQSNSEQKDLDYISDMTSISAYWEGFNDPHTPIKDYFVSLGSCVECENILTEQPVGLEKDIEIKNLDLVEGIRYYFTIRSCNVAGLCTTVSSDGFVVDTSPPSTGRVLDGVNGKDALYQCSKNYLGAKWYDFTDPQSGIVHFEWRAGTSSEGSDILPRTNVHHEEIAFIPDMIAATGKQLPLGVPIYVTVRAYNKAGSFSEASSNGFIVDATPPVFIQELKHVRIGSAVLKTSVLRRLLKLEWQVEDKESFIDEQFLSLSTHVGGEFNASTIKVEGIVRDYTFTGLDLHDGCFYDVTLISCNGAYLCTKSQVKDILVDASPPTPGMFAINTDHAANLDRQPNEYMTWTILSIKLSWLGFEDYHSGISHYIINIGSSYMGNELNEEAGIPYNISHDDGGMAHTEGTLQMSELRTKPLSSLVQPASVYISIFSVNGVGQPSAIIHSQFWLLFGGMMQLVRRCSPYTCYGHCVCATHGGLCHHADCTDYTSNNPHNQYSVVDYTDLTFPTNENAIKFSPINEMLAACWKLISSNGQSSQWFEWSVGKSSYAEPKDVFNTVTDRVWHDAGQRTCIYYVLPAGSTLSERVKYSVFVRVWYSTNEYAVFKSPGVMIYSSRPMSTNIRGRQVMEHTGAKKDVDFVDTSTKVYISWEEKFINTEYSLSKFHVYLSTYPGGHDALLIGKDLQPKSYQVELTGVELKPGIRYYAVVQAYNLAGLHTTESSDGVMLDTEPPVPGVVFDGQGPHDINAQSESDRVSAFWYGFKDLDSGIVKYEACLSYKTAIGGCHIYEFLDVGMATYVTFELEESLKTGDQVVTEVRATDAVGHRSKIVVSNGIVIDTTGPVRENKTLLEENILVNPSFEIADNFIVTNNLSSASECSGVPISGWEVQNDACFIIAKSEIQAAHEGNFFIILSGTIQQLLTGIATGQTYRITFYTSHLGFDTATKSSKTCFIRIGSAEQVFLLYSKPFRSDIKGDIIDVAWHKHTFYFHSGADTALLEIGTVGDTTGLAIDDISVQKLLTSSETEASEDGHVQVHSVFIHDWSSVHASWSFVDSECSVKEYLWAIGSVRGGTQFQAFKNVGRKTFADCSSLVLPHKSEIHVTVVAVNWAGLSTVSYSDPIFVDLTAPFIFDVKDGKLEGKDFDHQRENDISASWSVEDPESGVVSCEWAIGYHEDDTTLQNFTLVDPGVRRATTHFDMDLHGSKIYVTIKCTNGAGLSTVKSSDGVTVLYYASSTDSVILEVISKSTTQYQPLENYHADKTSVKFRWTGFGEQESIDSYSVALEGSNGFRVEELVVSNADQFMYASFQNLDLADGKYQISVMAFNEVDMYSQKATTDFILVTTSPKVSGSEMSVNWNRAAKELKIDWANVFEIPANSSMYYEVTVRIPEIANGDRVQWQETKDTSLVIQLDKDELPETGFTVLATVRGISFCGLFTTVQSQKYFV